MTPEVALSLCLLRCKRTISKLQEARATIKHPVALAEALRLILAEHDREIARLERWQKEHKQ